MTRSSQTFPFFTGESVIIDFTADSSIVGCSVEFWAARHRGTAPVLTTEGGSANATALISASPYFTVEAADEATEALTGTYEFEVWLQDLTGNRNCTAFGFLIFRERVAGP